MPASKRPICQRCERPLSACICRWVTPLAHATEVLILQHPLEVGHVKNSAGLLHRSLPNSRIVVGESFDSAAWDAAQRAQEQLPKYVVLLYPPMFYPGHAVPAALDLEKIQEPSRVRLVVLDGTWRKSRKMLHQSPCLQRLPRLSLAQTPASLYAIRKAHKPEQLSTLEATCLALAQLERDAAKFAPLLQAFKGFVAQQAAQSGAALA